MAAMPPQYRFSVNDYERMIRHGILTENSKVELIRGEIVAKMPIGDPHIACVNRLNRLLVRAVGDDAIVSIQNPVRLPDSEPEPDVVLLVPRADDYANGKATTADVLLLIEVSDTSLAYDRGVKLPLYAEAGIAEYWIVNLSDRCLHRYRQPQLDGTYAEVVTLGVTDMVELLLLKSVVFSVSSMF